ncbi:hypothetical protein B9Z19DRAFT_1134947 [Tuber borchii]|uniref:Uncharacterized protein n=1 Tax=Tuber borchii TaxID=42251 RepID=A0A2T6ZDU3_TUBBO|nr:hypothetical protein B9Z19DRAFT_1134947 [Tuber borchii]
MQRYASPQSSSRRLASPPPVALNQISNQITSDAGVPLDLEHAYTKLSDDALARSGGGNVYERAATDSSDEGETSSAEESAGANSPVSEEEEKRWRAAADRNGSGPSSKSSAVRTEETVEKGQDATKRVINMRRISVGLLAAAEEERMCSCLHSRGGSDFSDWKDCRVHGATSPTTNRRSGVHLSTNFDLLSDNSTAMSWDTKAEGCDLYRAQCMEMIFSPITSTLET